VPRTLEASLSFGESGTDFCKSWSSSAYESNIWRRSWGGAARLGTGDGSVDARGDMASMARGMIGVEPRGFEPSTPAVQRRHDTLLDLSA
jgi:hypothetical protein